MGFLAAVLEPKVYGVNSSHAEWLQALQQAVLGSLQDEEDRNHPYEFAWDHFLPSFPQLTFREFVIACAGAAEYARLVAK